MSLPQTSKKRLTQVLGSTSRLSSFDFAFLGSSCLSPFSCSSRNFEAFCHFTACSKKRKRPKRLPPPARPRTKNLVMVPGNTSPATKGPVTTVGSLCQGYRSPGTKPRAGARGGAWPELARAWGAISARSHTPVPQLGRCRRNDSSKGKLHSWSWPSVPRPGVEMCSRLFSWLQANRGATRHD